MYGAQKIVWVLCFALASLTSACRSTDSAKKATPSPPGVEMSLSGGVRFIESVDGVKRWDISAQRADYSTGIGMLNLSPIQADYYEDGVLKYKVSAKEGIYDSKREVLNVRGDIFAESNEGYTLKTERLEYRLKERIATTDDYFEVHGKGLDFFGTGLNADFEQGIFRVFNGVKLKVLPSQLQK